MRYIFLDKKGGVFVTDVCCRILREEYCIKYHEILIEKAENLIQRNKDLNEELEILYVRENLFKFENVREVYPSNELQEIKSKIKSLESEQKNNYELLNRYTIEDKRLVYSYISENKRGELKKFPE